LRLNYNNKPSQHYKNQLESHLSTAHQLRIQVKKKNQKENMKKLKMHTKIKICINLRILEIKNQNPQLLPPRLMIIMNNLKQKEDFLIINWKIKPIMIQIKRFNNKNKNKKKLIVERLLKIIILIMPITIIMLIMILKKIEDNANTLKPGQSKKATFTMASWD